MNNIFLNPGRRSEWLELLNSGDITATRILKNLRNQKFDPNSFPKDDPNINERQANFGVIQKQICLAWLEKDHELANLARVDFLKMVEGAQGSDLGKASNALLAVLLWDFGSELWNSSEREEFASRIEAMAQSFLDVGGDNPHVVTNNWWMLTHGACLLSCIAVDGEPGLNGPIDLSDLKKWSFERFKVFCNVFGNAGLYHEGSGYIEYTLSMLMPTLVAVQKHLDPSILNEFPQFKRSIVSMLTGTATFEHKNGSTDQAISGASLQWNDAGRNALGWNPFIPGMALAPNNLRGALRTVFDRLNTFGSGQLRQSNYNGLPLLVALYPFSTAPVDPAGILPKHVLDQRQGLGMWRSAWGDGQETVFGWYARSTHAGGHVQDDAASIRLMTLGRTWICGGGQARSKSQWQSVFTHADMAMRPKPAPLAHLICNSIHEYSGVVGIDTRSSLGAYSERYLSWRTDTGCPFALAIMDQLDEHRDPPLDWQWNLSFPRDLKGIIHEDGAGFSLIDKERGQLDARFLIDRPQALEILEMPGSSRTYSAGSTVDYPGDFYIHAKYPGLKKGRILVGIALAPSDAGSVDIQFRDNAIFMNGEKWESPFSPGILKSVNLAQSEPNRMTLPAG